MEIESLPLLRTKLHRPPVAAGSVCRQRLHKLLGRALELPLTVVSAPAGYGKSTLVSQWAESLEQPSGWLSLDPSDSDLKLFLRYLLAAADSVQPAACPETRLLCNSPNPLPIPVLGACLVNELDALEAPLLLVLDDYYRIDPGSEVHELLRFLLEHPPRGLRLVLVSRSDPPLLIAPLRARGQVLEIRLRELRFTPAECAEYLAQTAEVRVSEPALANLERQTEGWIVALRLVALHLGQIDDPEAALLALHGGVQQTREYLLLEVIEHLPPLTRDWMLRSAVLERFCAELCDALASTPEETTAEDTAYDGAQLIRDLTTGNLFTIPLDLEGRWFRYHHLFQEMLHQQLQARMPAPEIAALHRRASAWFEQAGLIDEALQHALAGDDLELAAQQVARHRHAMLDTDRWYVLENWLSLLPETLIQQRPELLMVRAWLLMHHSRFEALFPLLDRVEALLGDAPTVALRGEIALCRGYGLFLMGQGEQSLQQITRALARIPTDHYEARAQSEIIYALSSQMMGRKQQALRTLDELLAHYDSPQPLRKTRLLISYVFIHFIDADLSAAELANRRLREIVERDDYPYVQTWTDYMQGLIHLQRGEWPGAMEYLGRAVTQRFIHFKRAAMDSMAALMLARQAAGQAAEANATAQLLRDYVGSLQDATLWPLVSSAELRLCALRGQPECGPDWTEAGLDAMTLPAEGAMLWWLDLPSVTRCRPLIAAGAPAGLRQAEALLQTQIEINQAHHNRFQLIGVLALQALALHPQGRTEQALDLLQRALTLALPGGLVFPFLELGAPMAALLRQLPREAATAPFLDRILAAAETAPSAAPAPTEPPAPDLLTDREQEILALLAQRLQYKEIAARLVISPQTVNSHLKNVYQKLGVSNRRQAVARAAELGLLSST